MHIRQLDLHNRTDQRLFLRLPFELYRGSTQWVPPISGAEAALFDTHRNPFYQHSQAAFFLAERTGVPVGRIVAMINRNHNRYRGVKTAFFGFFDVYDDRQAALGLLESACTWAKQAGSEEMIGPRGLVGSDSGGLLVEGFDLRPALNVPYNHAYYDGFVQEAGFHKDRDHLSGYLPGNYVLPERFYEIAERIKARRGFTIQHFSSVKELRQWAPQAVAVHQQAFINNHEYFPPTPAETAQIVESVLMVTDPRLIKLVLHHGKVVGFVLAYHDISTALQKSGGRLWPFGWWHILQERKRAEWVNVNGIGLLPEYRGMGANTLLYTELQKSVRALGFKHIEVIQVDETNYKSRNDMEAIGVRWYKRHRNYRRPVCG